jgi:F-type H+-transporting ATPase subunit delta
MSKFNGEKPAHETVMDVTVEQVARVYAQAFMRVIQPLANADALVDELKSVVADVLNPNPRLEKTLASSLIPQEQKEQMLDRIFGKAASPQLLNFVKVLSRHGRLELLRPIARQVQQLHLEHRNIATVEVRVAAELDDALRNDIQARLQRRLGKTPVLNVKLDPSIIAGIVVRVGDQVFDGSIRTQLEATRKLMIDHAIEQIETKPDRFLTSV